MRKIFILIFIFLINYCLTGQDVAKECVLFEGFTGVNCPYCPAAANGIEQMLEEGLQIAPVEYHTSAFSGPELYTSETNARANYYSISAYPTMIADGLKRIEGGGDAGSSMYTYYLNLYNQRINIPSPFTIDLTCGTPTGTEYPVTCTVNQVGTNASNNLRIFIVLTQCNIPRNWQGMNKLDHVVRDMIPNQNGTIYNGGTYTVEETFDLGNYPKEDCYLTAWVQDYYTKEVFQAVRLSLNYADYEYDLVIKELSDVTKHNCSGITTANITIKNYGSKPISSFDVIAKVDGEETYRTTWSGTAINFTETTSVQIPEINFGSASSIEFLIENPNGHSDENPTNNSITFSAEDSFLCSKKIILVFRTDSHPEQDTITWKDMTTGEIIETLTFNHSNKQYVHEFNFTQYHCYRLTIHDSGNDGISTYFTVYDVNEKPIYNGHSSINPFKTEISLEFSVESVGINDITENNNVIIYPNPTEDNINIYTGDDNYKVEIFNICGRKVYENKQSHDGNLNINMLHKGVYIVKLSFTNNSVTKKIVIK